MDTHNLEITIKGHLCPQTFLFNVEKSALDFIQQAGPKNCLPSVLEFLTSCVSEGVIELDIEELYKKNVVISILIPERNINISAEIEKPSVNNMVIENENDQTIDNDSIACSSNSNKETEITEKMSDLIGRKPDVMKNETETTTENEKEATNCNSIFTEGMTKYMLEKYGKFMNYVGPLKKYKKKIDMWKQIAVDMEMDFGVKFTHIQIENRYKTICKRKKEVLTNNRSSGAVRIEDPYEEEWKQITNKDDSIVPEVMRSARTVIINRKEVFEPKPKKQKVDNSQVLLLNFLKQKEEAKERHHKEKMELIKSLMNK